MNVTVDNEKFLEAAHSQGYSQDDADTLFKIVTETSPPIPAEQVDVFGIELPGAFRVEREYDGQLRDAGHAGHVSLALTTPLGIASFVVDKAQLLNALLVEVPYVATPVPPSQ